MMPRTLRAVAATAVLGAGLLAGGPAAAQDAVPEGWGASHATVEGNRLHGVMQRDGQWPLQPWRPYTVTVRFTVARPSDLPAECAVPEIPAPAPAATRVPFDVTPIFECNGAYPVAITGTADGGGGTATLNRTIQVAMPAPAVTGVEVALDGEAIDITWDDMTPQVKDLTGYQVTRQVDAGEPEVVVEVPRSPDGSIATSARDEELPDEGDVLTYEVVAVRNGTGPGPAEQGSRAAITREGEVVEPATPDPGSGPGGTGEGSAAGGGGAGGANDGRARPTRVNPPRVSTGTFRPPPFTAAMPGGRSSSPGAGDPGYDQDLPYNAVDGPLDAERPDDELAAFFNGEGAGRGMAIPIATALVLAVWAFHLRVLARAAKPTA